MLVVSVGACQREEPVPLENPTVVQQEDPQDVAAPEERPKLGVAAESSFGWPLPEGVEPLRMTEEAHSWEWVGERADLMGFYAEHVPHASRMDVERGARFRRPPEDFSALYALPSSSNESLWRIVVFRDDRMPVDREVAVGAAEPSDEPERIRLRWLEAPPERAALPDSRPESGVAPTGSRRQSPPPLRPSQLPTSTAPAIPGGAFYPPGSGAAEAQTPRVNNRLGARRPDGAPVRFFEPTNPEAGF